MYILIAGLAANGLQDGYGASQGNKAVLFLSFMCGGYQMNKKELKLIRESLNNIITPNLEELGFTLVESVTIERERIWRYIKRINNNNCEIVFRFSLLKTISVDFCTLPGLQFSLTELDDKATFETKIFGYQYDSEEKFREQLQYMKEIILKRGVPKMEVIANRGK